MGIPPTIARCLVSFCIEQDLVDQIGSSCLTLGKQFIHLSEAQLFQMLAEFDLARIHDGKVSLVESIGRKVQKLMEADRVLATVPERREMGEVSDEMFFKSIGFDELKSLDADDFEGADFIFDLNDTGISATIGGQYDCVFDGGSMEHVFLVQNVFRNIFDALKTGGCVIHAAPCNNMVDHGFYQFSPLFFYQYYEKNNYEILKCAVLQQTSNAPYSEPITLYDYVPGALHSTVFAGSGSYTYGTMIHARKTEESTWDKVPQQLDYQVKWDSGGQSPSRNGLSRRKSMPTATGTSTPQ